MIATSHISFVSMMTGASYRQKYHYKRLPWFWLNL